MNVSSWSWHIWNVSLDIVCIYICLFAFFWHGHCPTFWYREGPLTLELRGSKCHIILRYGKTGNKKRLIPLATLQQNELNSATAHEKKNLAILFVARQVRTLVPCEQRFLQRPAWRNHCSQGRTLVVKRATSLFISFCSNVAKQVELFIT